MSRPRQGERSLLFWESTDDAHSHTYVYTCRTPWHRQDSLKLHFGMQFFWQSTAKYPYEVQSPSNVTETEVPASSAGCTAIAKAYRSNGCTAIITAWWKETRDVIELLSVLIGDILLVHLHQAYMDEFISLWPNQIQHYIPCHWCNL